MGYLILRFILFFSIFIVSFILLPRYIFVSLKRIMKLNNSFKPLKDFFRLLVSYIVIGSLLTILIYSTSSFAHEELKSVLGDNLEAISFLVVMTILISIRISIVMKKRVHLNKINPFETNIFAMVPSLKPEEKAELNKEYFSFVFNLLFAGLFFGLMIISFKFIFLPNVTLFTIPTINISSKSFIDFILPFLKYGGFSLALVFLSEILILIFGHHES